LNSRKTSLDVLNNKIKFKENDFMMKYYGPPVVSPQSKFEKSPKSNVSKGSTSTIKIRRRNKLKKDIKKRNEES